MNERRIGPGRLDQYRVQLADVECGDRPRVDGVVVVHEGVYD